MDDLDIPDRWFLGDPVDREGEEVSASEFSIGIPLGKLAGLRIPVSSPGPALDFTLAAFDTPVVRPHIGKLLESLEPESVERIPVWVEGVDGDFEILNVVSLERCVDEARSEIQYWTEADDRPDKVGQYRMIPHLVLVRSAVRKRIFRVTGWGTLILAESVVRLLQDCSITGIQFEQLETS